MCASYSSSCLLLYLSFLAGPGPRQDIAVSAFSPFTVFLTPPFRFFLCFRLLSTDNISSWFSPRISFYTFSTTPFRPISARSFVTFSQSALSAMAGNVFFSMPLTLYCQFNFLTPICSKWVFRPLVLLVLHVLAVPTYSQYVRPVCSEYDIYFAIISAPCR